jgi:hypothetical protein
MLLEVFSWIKKVLGLREISGRVFPLKTLATPKMASELREYEKIFRPEYND